MRLWAPLTLPALTAGCLEACVRVRTCYPSFFHLAGFSLDLRLGLLWRCFRWHGRSCWHSVSGEGGRAWQAGTGMGQGLVASGSFG